MVSTRLWFMHRNAGGAPGLRLQDDAEDGLVPRDREDRARRAELALRVHAEGGCKARGGGGEISCMPGQTGARRRERLQERDFGVVFLAQQAPPRACAHRPAASP